MYDGQQQSMLNNNARSENYPLLYGPVAPAPGYYSGEMTRQLERRPLHPVQQEAPSLIGKIAHNTQRQQQMVHMYHGQGRQPPQPSMCGPGGPPQPPQSQPAGGQQYSRFAAPAPEEPYSYSQPMDFPLSGQPTQAGYLQHRGYFAPPAPPAPPAPSAPFYAGSQQSQQRQQPAYGHGMVMYSGSPPSGFADFTPMYTSSPLETSGAYSCAQPAAARPPAAASAVPQGPRGPPVREDRAWAQPAAPTPAKHPARQQPAQPRVHAAPHAARQARQQEPPASQGSSASSRRGSLPATPSRTPPSSQAVSAGPPKAAASPFAEEADVSQSQPRSRPPSESTGRARTTPAPEPLRVLTGTVDDIRIWGGKLDEETRPNVLFEIIGLLDSAVRGPKRSSVLVCLRSLQGSATLQAVFWEIDRPLSPPANGSVVQCVCRLCPKGRPGSVWRMPRMQVLQMRALSAAQVPNFKRLLYVSNFCVQQGVLTSSKQSSAPAAAPAPAPLKQALISQYTAPRPPAGPAVAERR